MQMKVVQESQVKMLENQMHVLDALINKFVPAEKLKKRIPVKKYFLLLIKYIAI